MTIQATNSGTAATFIDTAAPGSDGPGAAATETPPLMPQPGVGGLGADSMTALAILLTRADSQDRTAARASEDAADTAAVQQEHQRVAQMMDKADQDQDAAVATGAGDIVGGTLTAGSGFMPDGAATIGADGSKSAASTNWRSVLDGAGRAMPGVGTIVAGGYKAAGDRDDARAADFEAGAQTSLRRCDQARDDAQAADASIQRVQELLQSVQQTEAATRASASSLLKG